MPGRHAGTPEGGRGTHRGRPRGYRGTRGDRSGREPSFREETVRVTEDGREVPVHREEHPRPRHAGRAPEDEHPAPDADARPGGAASERRKSHKFVRRATAIGLLALTTVGAIQLIRGVSGDDTPKIPTGPALLEPSNNPNAGANLTGDALKAQLHADVQRLVNNGEHGKTVTVAPGVLTIKTPDGQRVSYANPIVDLDGLTQQAAANVKAGKFDASSWNLLDGRVFATGAAKDTPIQGQEGHNFDRGVVDLDVTGTDAQFTPSPNGPHLTDVAVSWETSAPIAVGSGGPLEQNVKTGQYGQHDVGGNWQPMLVGAQVNTPPGAGPSNS
jgi:hypothetical protein